jgi:EAL domain-containing protein (putative c-di-GMP-specific phosphodiesterase class I)
VGFEALSRFDQDPPRAPDAWFAVAAEVGRGIDLELIAVRLALDALPHLPPDLYLSINASPDLVQSGSLATIMADQPCDRIVLELTEHAAIANRDLFDAEMFKLRIMGIRLAVDDAGAGYSGLQHIVQLRPDIIKLDMSLTRHVDVDPIRRSLAGALVNFGADTGADIVAEGIETAAEADTLRRIGIALGQGYLFGRPLPLARVLERERFGKSTSRAASA